MQNVFDKIINMNITASVVILVVILARFLLKDLPKKYSYALWGIVGFRLCCPVSFKSVVSIFNINPVQQPTDIVTNSGEMNYIDAPVNMITPQANSDIIGGADASVTTIVEHNFADFLPYIWLVGLVGLLIYGFVNYFIVRSKLSTATKKESNIYQSERITTPFILGIIMPKIYIPYSIDDEYYEYIISHEKYHLKRKDNIIKLIAYSILCVHWFNPLCWLAFYLMNKDMEMSCDEWVLEHNEGIKKIYSNALLSFATAKKFPSPSPLCFGEGSAKGRIKNILKYKKPALIASIIAIILCIAIAVVCVANPKDKNDAEPNPVTNEANNNSINISTPTNDDNEYFDEQFEDLYQKVTMDYSPENSYPHYPNAKSYQEYKNIVSKGEEALRYIFERFNQGRRVNIKGELMIMVFQDLIGDEQIKCNAENGQEYFNAWVLHYETLLEKNDINFIKENYPCAYLYLTEYKSSKTYDEVAKYINFNAYVYENEKINKGSVTFSSFEYPNDNNEYSPFVRWQKTEGLPNVKSATMIAEQNGNIIYSKELQIDDVRATTFNNSAWDYVIKYDKELTIKCDTSKSIDLYIKAIDENNVEYKIFLQKTAYNDDNLAVVEIVDGNELFRMNGSGSIFKEEYDFILDKYWYTVNKDEATVCCIRFTKNGTMETTEYTVKNGKWYESYSQNTYSFDENDTIVYYDAFGVYSKAFIQIDTKNKTIAEYDRNTMNDDKSKQTVLVKYIPKSENSLEIAKSLL